MTENSDKKVYNVENKADMDALREEYTRGVVQSTEGSYKQSENKGNHGWQYIAELADAEYDVLQFEKYFNNWQKQAILLTELTYAETYNYVTPLGVFTDIGTLARALQYIFQKNWDVSAVLTGTELTFLVDKGIKGARHSLVCKFVEFNQAYSDIHCDGWKLDNGAEKVIGFEIDRSEAVAVINSLTMLLLDREMTSSVHFGEGQESVRIQSEEGGDRLMLTRVPNPPAEPSED